MPSIAHFSNRIIAGVHVMRITSMEPPDPCTLKSGVHRTRDADLEQKIFGGFGSGASALVHHEAPLMRDGGRNVVGKCRLASLPQAHV